ncbi:unnamed protein product [Caenorhabditis nigoni]
MVAAEVQVGCVDCTGICMKDIFNMNFFTTSYFVFLVIVVLAIAASMVAAEVQVECVDCTGVCMKDMCVHY